MLEINVELKNGIIFIRLEGMLNMETFNQFDMELSYLLYKQGINYYVVDFSNVYISNYNVIFRIENKIREILLNRGKIIFNGINSRFKNYYLDCNFNERDGCCFFKYLNI